MPTQQRVTAPESLQQSKLGRGPLVQRGGGLTGGQGAVGAEGDGARIRASTVALRRASVMHQAPPLASSTPAVPSAPKIPAEKTRSLPRARSTSTFGSLWSKTSALVSADAPPPVPSSSTHTTSASISTKKSAHAKSKSARASISLVTDILPSGSLASASFDRALRASTITPFITPNAEVKAAEIAAEDSTPTPQESTIYNTGPVSLPLTCPAFSAGAAPLSKAKSDPTGRAIVQPRPEIVVEPITWFRPPPIHPRDYKEGTRKRAQSVGKRSPFDWLDPMDMSTVDPYLFHRSSGRALVRRKAGEVVSEQPSRNGGATTRPPVPPLPPRRAQSVPSSVQEFVGTPRPTSMAAIFHPPLPLLKPVPPQFTPVDSRRLVPMPVQPPRAPPPIVVSSQVEALLREQRQQQTAMQEAQRLAEVARQQSEAEASYTRQKETYERDKAAYLAQLTAWKSLSVVQTSPSPSLSLSDPIGSGDSLTSPLFPKAYPPSSFPLSPTPPPVSVYAPSTPPSSSSFPSSLPLSNYLPSYQPRSLPPEMVPLPPSPVVQLPSPLEPLFDSSRPSSSNVSPTPSPKTPCLQSASYFSPRCHYFDSSDRSPSAGREATSATQQERVADGSGRGRRPLPRPPGYVA
ncbi:hypothetical protein P7C70_g8673, partial [Phenoliferia sp. Uapishka_3]